MFTFTPEEREYLTEMRAIVFNKDGQEVLVGLTLEETEAYMTHRREFSSGNRNREFRRMALELGEKHEIARLQLIGMEERVRLSDSAPN